MDAIEYEITKRNTEIAVRLGGRRVGTIRPVIFQSNAVRWHYVPIGKRDGGTAYETIGQVKKSIEGAE